MTVTFIETVTTAAGEVVRHETELESVGAAMQAVLQRQQELGLMETLPDEDGVFDLPDGSRIHFGLDAATALAIFREAIRDVEAGDDGPESCCIWDIDV